MDPRNAFHHLMQAWEEFHAAVVETEDADAPRVMRACERLADAYTVYDDVLFTHYGVEAPFDTYDVDDEGDFDDGYDDSELGDSDFDDSFDSEDDYDDGFDDDRFDDDASDYDDASYDDDDYDYGDDFDDEDEDEE